MLLLSVAALGMQAGCSSNETAKSTAVNQEAESTSEASETQESAEAKIEKPEKITVLYDMGTLTQTAGLNEWIARWEELTGIELELITPDHDAYTDIVGQTRCV